MCAVSCGDGMCVCVVSCGVVSLCVPCHVVMVCLCVVSCGVVSLCVLCRVVMVCVCVCVYELFFLRYMYRQ